MHDRTESEVAGSVDVTGLDPTEGGGDETVSRDWLRPHLLIWTSPEREPACDRTGCCDVSGEAGGSRRS